MHATRHCWQNERGSGLGLYNDFVPFQAQIDVGMLKSRYGLQVPSSFEDHLSHPYTKAMHYIQNGHSDFLVCACVN